MNQLLLLALITIFSSISVAHAEISKEKRKEIEKLLQLTGAEKLAFQVKTQMISALKAEMAEVPESFWEKVQKKMDTREQIGRAHV